MSVPEPLGFTRSILSFGLLFAGIPTGLIFYSVIVKKWLTSIAPKIIIGFVAFPIYTLAGVIGSISFIIYKGIFIFKNNKRRKTTRRIQKETRESRKNKSRRSI